MGSWCGTKHALCRPHPCNLRSCCHVHRPHAVAHLPPHQLIHGMVHQATTRFVCRHAWVPECQALQDLAAILVVTSCLVRMGTAVGGRASACVLMSWCKQVAHCIQACPHTGAARWVLTTRCSVAEAALECPVLAACHLECHLEHDSTRSMGREVYRPCQTCHSLVRVVLAGVVAGVVGGGEDADSTASLTLTTSSRHRMGCTSRLYF